MKNLLKNNWTSMFLIISAFVWAALRIQDLPSNIPSHFDVHGNPDNLGNKYFVLTFLPLTNLFIVFLIGGLAKISPNGFDMPNSQKLIGHFNFGITAFLTIMYIGMILEGEAPNQGIFSQMILPGFALFMFS